MTPIDHLDLTTGRVLLVEDNEAHAALIRRVLGNGNAGLKVERVASLTEARDRIAAQRHDLALVDMNLPDGSGLELIDSPATSQKRLAVVIMTGQGCEEVAVDAMRRGALDYVVKSAEHFPANIPHVISRALREVDHIRERERAENTVRHLAAQYRSLYDDAPAMFFTVDGDANIVSVNRFGARRMGYPPEALIGRPVTLLYPDSERERVQQQLRDLRDGERRVSHWELQKLRSDGSTFWARETARAVEDEGGTLRTLMVCEDITESHQRLQELSHQATHDALTGLVNRREFERRLGRLLSELPRAPSEHVLCYVDLDRFKEVNDTGGHAAGDELLRMISERLQERVRKRDTLARLGGDEFGVLMEHCTAEQGMRVAESVREGVSEIRFVWEDREFSVGASVGLVAIPRTGSTIGEVMASVDAACYAAKRAGRNRVHVHRMRDVAPDLRQRQLR